jgi:hypothetical protein
VVLTLEAACTGLVDEVVQCLGRRHSIIDTTRRPTPRCCRPQIWPHLGKLANPRAIFQGSSKTSAATFAMTGQSTTGSSEELRLVCGRLVGPSRLS